jgi:hypothetical protein
LGSNNSSRKRSLLRQPGIPSLRRERHHVNNEEEESGADLGSEDVSYFTCVHTSRDPILNPLLVDKTLRTIAAIHKEYERTLKLLDEHTKLLQELQDLNQSWGDCQQKS